MIQTDLTGRIAVVSGASAGIGLSIARTLVSAGASVVLNARRADRLEALVAELGPSRAAAVAGDCVEPAIITRMLDTARERFGRGTRQADLVVVNAGRGLRGSPQNSDDAQWEEVIRTNTLGAARLIRAAADRMVGPVPVVRGAPKDPPKHTPPEGWPAVAPRDIVVLGSTVGRHISPFSSMYGSTKASVHMIAETMRRVLAPSGVRVSLLEPGIVRSEFQEVAGYDPQSFGQFMDSIAPVLEPDHIAELVLYICSRPAGVCVNNVMIRPTRQEYP